MADTPRMAGQTDQEDQETAGFWTQESLKFASILTFLRLRSCLKTLNSMRYKTCDVFLSSCIRCPQGPTIDPMVVMLRDFSGFMIWHDKVFFFLPSSCIHSLAPCSPGVNFAFFKSLSWPNGWYPDFGWFWKQIRWKDPEIRQNSRVTR